MLLWRAAFWHVGSASRHYMIGGVFGVVKGVFSCGFARRGIPAYAGMTGGGAGHDGDGAGYDGMGGWEWGNAKAQRKAGGNDVMGGREWGNAKAQGRNEKQAGDSRLRGNDGGGVGHDGRDEGYDVMGCGSDTHMTH